MTTTSPTTVSTTLTTSSTPTIITEVDIPLHYTDEASNFSNESFSPLTHVSTMTAPINIPKNHYKWDDYDGHVFEKNLNVIYDIIIYWKKNLFMLHTGRAGKDYIDEFARLLNAWTQDSAMKHITFKVIMVMRSLILQKTSRNSKAKDHSEALRRRVTLWQSVELLQLFKEAKTIQNRLTYSTKPKSIAQMLKSFEIPRTRGGSGPSGMDADGWGRILTSNSFGKSSTNICIALANVAKKSCVEADQTDSLEAFLASRLIPLDKNSGLRPIGVGEVIGRITERRHYQICWKSAGVSQP